MIVRVSVVLSLRRTVVRNGDWRFDNLSESHSQSQVKGCCQSNDRHPKLYNYTYPDDQTTLLHVTRELKPFTVNNCWYYTNILHFWSFLIFLELSHLCNDFLQLLVCIVFVLFSINYWKCIVTAAFCAHSLGYFECFLGCFCWFFVDVLFYYTLFT